MEDVESWLANARGSASIFASPRPESSSSSATTSSTRSAPTLREDSSFNSLESLHSKSLSHLCIASFKTTASQITSLAVQNNKLYAASIKEINVFDLTTLSLVETFGSGSGCVKSIAFSGKKIFTAHQDCKIRVWQQVTTSSYKQKHHLISTLPTLKDRLINCVSPKNYVHVRRHKQKLWIDHADAVSALAPENDAGLLYSVSWDKTLKAWNLSSGMRCLESVTAHSDAVNAVAVHPSNGTVYTGSADGQIKVWTTNNDGRRKRRHRLAATLAKHESGVNALALTADGSGLFSGGGDRVILVWEKEGDGNKKNEDGNRKNEDGNKKKEEGNNFFVCCSLKGHNGPILCLVSVDGVLVSGSSDRSVRIWKYGKGSGGSCLAIMEGHCKPVKSLVGIPSGDLDDCLTVFSGSLDGEIRAWKVVIPNCSTIN